MVEQRFPDEISLEITEIENNIFNMSKRITKARSVFSTSLSTWLPALSYARSPPNPFMSPSSEKTKPSSLGSARECNWPL
jgi:hypothetical protein